MTSAHAPRRARARARQLVALALVLGVSCAASGCGGEGADDPGGPGKMSEPKGWKPWLTSFHGGGRDEGPAGEVNACAPGDGGELHCAGTGFRDETLKATTGEHRPGDGAGEPDRHPGFARAEGLTFTSEQKDEPGKEGALGGEREVRALEGRSGEERWKHGVRTTAVLDRGGTPDIVGDEPTAVTNEPEDGEYEDWSPRFAPGGDIVSWDARTGEERWRAETPGDQWCSPTRVGGRTFVTCVEDELDPGKVTWYTLDGQAGELHKLYAYQSRNQEELEPVGMHERALVFLPPKGSDFPPAKEFTDLVRVNADTGKVERHPLPEALGKGARPHLVGGDLYFERALRGDGKQLVAVGADDGEERWKARTSLEHTSEPTVSLRRDEVYLADPAGRLVAFDRRGGERLWETGRARAEDGGTDPGEMDAASSVTLVRDVLVVSTGNTVFSVSPEDPDAEPRERHRVELDS